ncbi:hypothetical protein [Mucilaginibacter gotjawali]|uniref:Uncharacterized protein n=2 Tax=Mucilaginibacter gotjawali TaxID=1550579 RepID=A0A110B268_9SPHI|nr:hypothetical protein [Mucilaginibacter gotjawali]MBB3054281.1 hypothetical protein [Mucilaginibacter gotjawali]BAU51884.1 hypothetical protein MgSA37_00033 [Mucilaginibacter gotjawali]
MEIIHAHKSYWKEYDVLYMTAVEIEAVELLLLISRLERWDIIEWLMWNDPNGIYSDESSLREFGAVMTKEDGTEIMLRQAEENRVVKNLKLL